MKGHLFLLTHSTLGGVVNSYLKLWAKKKITVIEAYCATTCFLNLFAFHLTVNIFKGRTSAYFKRCNFHWIVKRIFIMNIIIDPEFLFYEYGYLWYNINITNISVLCTTIVSKDVVLPVLHILFFFLISMFDFDEQILQKYL